MSLHSTTMLVMLVILLILGGPTLAWKFLRGYFRGVDVYVVLEKDGRTLAYKNPQALLGHEDQPLDSLPNEVMDLKRFQPYYNICWFECGTLYRCGHSTHRTQKDAWRCKDANVRDCFVGTVYEER